MENALIKSWKSLAAEASIDGLVCDIQILHTSIQEWRLFFDFVKANYPYKYSIGKTVDVIEEPGEDYFMRDELRLLGIYLDHVILECIILDAGKIQINVAPRLIMEPEILSKFFNFIRNIGFQVKKQVEITIEGYSEPLITFSPTLSKFFNGKGEIIGA